MAKGQAEALFPLIETVIAERGWSLADLDVIGVATGPGNFTGIRISVSAARGLGLALRIPVFGISQFELAYGSAPVPPTTLVSVPAPRDMAFVLAQSADGGTAQMIDPNDPPAALQLSCWTHVHGYRAHEIATTFNAQAVDQAYKPDPARMAEIAQALYANATEYPASPAPNYVKPPDAAPARDTPPRIIP